MQSKHSMNPMNQYVILVLIIYFYVLLKSILLVFTVCPHHGGYLSLVHHMAVVFWENLLHTLQTERSSSNASFLFTQVKINHLSNKYHTSLLRKKSFFNSVKHAQVKTAKREPVVPLSPASTNVYQYLISRQHDSLQLCSHLQVTSQTEHTLTQNCSFDITIQSAGCQSCLKTDQTQGSIGKPSTACQPNLLQFCNHNNLMF